MDYEFRFQDPTKPPRSPLIDELTDLLSRSDAVECRCIFAFVTGRGLNALLADTKVKRFFRRGKIDFVLGLDAITDRAALECLQSLQPLNPNFLARVLHNESGALFHPKVIHVKYASGGGAIIVGSANLTLGGLSGNIEAYSILRYNPDSPPDFGDWDDFVTRWGGSLGPIDEEAMRRAERNERALARATKRAAKGPEAKGREFVVEEGLVLPEIIPSEQRVPRDLKIQEPMLVAQIPAAGGRWSQVHFSREIVEHYFGIQPEKGGLVRLRQLNTSFIEERPVVFSAESNRNVKIEIGAAHGLTYPKESRPVLVVRQEGTRRRRYRYLLLMPGEMGHQEMLDLTKHEYKGPSNQVPRVIVPRAAVIAPWPECPL